MILFVKKGQHDFRRINGSLEVPWILPSFVDFRFRFKFNPECVYPSMGDKDLAGDWNKGGGMSRGFETANNKNSAQWAWRSSEVNGMIEVAPYFNKDSQNLHSKYGSVFFAPYSWGECTISKRKKNYTVKITHLDTGQEVVATEELGGTWFVRKIGAWFGGWDNDGNGLGGVAPNDMTIEVFFSIF